jgi:hypothetical protein
LGEVGEVGDEDADLRLSSIARRPELTVDWELKLTFEVEVDE